VLSANPAGVRGNKRSICFVVNTLSGVQNNGENGVDGGLVAGALTRAGWHVHVLCCEKPIRQPRRAAGFGLSWLGDFERPPEFTVPCRLCPAAIDRSEHVRVALEELHRTHGFAVVEFAERGALGFRAIQARRAGNALPGVRFVVKLRGSSQWLREEKGQWPLDEKELMLDYCERYAFENADAQSSLRPSLLEHARSVGWNVRPDARVIANPLQILEEYERLLSVCESPLLPEETPLVSVVVPHFNLAAFLPETLASLAVQTWPHLEVLVIDDGSDDPEAVAVFERMRLRYPQFRFLTQPNAGIGATRNRGLCEARGEFFVCVDADNIARPEMIERFVRGMQHRPDCSALSCYFLAFPDDARLARGQFAFAYRPTGGPHVVAALHNVYGDANAIFRTKDFREVGGFETDRDTSFEDWEAFVKLVHRGKRVDVLPEHLFYYRTRGEGFSQVTNDYCNRQRVLRQFRHAPPLPLAEQLALWQGLASAHRHLQEARTRQQSLRYRLADKLSGWLRRVPLLHRLTRGALRQGSAEAPPGIAEKTDH